MENLTTVMNTAELIKILKDNRDKHVETYKKALEGWRKCITEEFAKVTELAASEQLFSVPTKTLVLMRDVPRDHTDDYDLAIRMMELHTNDIIELSYSDFRNLVLDKWTWSDSFITTASNYTR